MWRFYARRNLIIAHRAGLCGSLRATDSAHTHARRKGFLTIKGRTNAEGTTRQEWEYEIPINEARELLSFSAGTISKVRHLAPMADGHTFEIDCFYGENAGLIVAEIELQSADEEFLHPAWLGREVTGDRRYYNSQLLKMPYSQWKEK